MTDQSPSGGFLTPGRILALVVLLGVVGVVMMEKSAQNQAQAAFDKLPEEGSFGDWNLPKVEETLGRQPDDMWTEGEEQTVVYQFQGLVSKYPLVLTFDVEPGGAPGQLTSKMVFETPPERGS